MVHLIYHEARDRDIPLIGIKAAPPSPRDDAERLAIG